MERVLAAVAATMLMSGCPMTHAEAIKVRDAEDAAKKARQVEIDHYLPVCSTDVQCADLWEAAIAWAAAHPKKRVLTAKPQRITVMFIGDPALGMDIRLKALGGGRYLEATVSCISWYGCAAEPDALRLEFNKALYKTTSQSSASQ